MESPSKAMIIAAVVLLGILLIASGMFIYSSSKSNISEGESQISEQEKTSFNKQWDTYEGIQSGTVVKALIQKLMSNSERNSSEKSKLISLYCYYPTSSRIEETGYKVDNTNVKDYIGYLQDLRGKIETKHSYWVQMDYSPSTSLINQINIYYSKEDANNYHIELQKSQLGPIN
jgi:hypothetical protein